VKKPGQYPNLPVFEEMGTTASEGTTLPEKSVTERSQRAKKKSEKPNWFQSDPRE